MQHSAFDLIRQHPIASLNTEVFEFKHRQTGASHFHFSSNNPENVFLVGFRTVPMDHKGTAHILEHTALCGSKKYPVRDPFFMMIRRSLNTFMNAFTSNDWTAYPFASTNRKDFFNLLDVYLDAAFFARLDELDFLQEGHRLEFAEANNPDSELVYKGVVFNEMKGAMSSISSTLWQTLCKHLFPSTTYHYNSGGDPEHITDLSYQELRNFYQTHYHPSNAMFASFGDIDVVDIQTQMHEQALQHFEPSSTEISVAREQRFSKPLHISEAYALDETDTSEKNHLVLAWLLGKNTSLDDVMQAQLLIYVLLENIACPLQQLLETSELGSAPSPLCGLEDSYQELVFCCGLQGASDGAAKAFEQQVLDTLITITEQGVDYERLEAIVDQLEFSQREITGDGYPYGLQIILNALPSVTHRGDPIALLDLDPVLKRLRESIKQADFIKQLIRDLLLENQHRVLLEMTPDTSLSAARQKAEANKLSDIKAHLNSEQAQHIIAQTEALSQRQQQHDDVSILPKVDLSDVPESIYYAEGENLSINGVQSHRYAQATNGIHYQQLLFAIPALSAAQIDLLPLYCQLLTECGIGEQNYTAVQHRQSAEVGDISAFTLVRSDINSEQSVQAYLCVSAKSLQRHREAMLNLLSDTLQHIRFDEHDRIKDIVSQQRMRKQNSISGAGHSYAMLSATQELSPIARLNENWSGISSIVAIQALDDKLKQEPNAAEELADQLNTLHQRIVSQPAELLSICDAENLEQFAESATKALSFSHTSSKNAALELAASRSHNKTAWLCNTQINFCAKVFATVPGGHPDAPALTVLGGYLRNGYLHTAIREQGGAYGAGANQDNHTASFKFYSYRDPRISGTLSDFSGAIDWMLAQKANPAALEEAILGVVASIDKPSAPASEAKQACHNQLFGRSKSQQQAFRAAVLAVSFDDLISVTKRYLCSETFSLGVIAPESNRNELKQLGLEIKKL